MTDEWAFEENEVLLEKRSRELYHVMNRVEDVDTKEQFYRLYDDTHTADVWYNAEDVTHDFVSIGIVAVGKPVQAEECREWYE